MKNEKLKHISNFKMWDLYGIIISVMTSQRQKALNISKRKKRKEKTSILRDYRIFYMEMVSPDLCR